MIGGRPTVHQDIPVSAVLTPICFEALLLPPLFLPCRLVSLNSTLTMPRAKAKPSEIALEAKKTYTPYIQSQLPQFPPISISYPDSSNFHLNPRANCGHKLRVAVISGDPVDVALDWDESNFKAIGSSKQLGSIPVVNMANEKRAGGDWESGLIAPEECLCRRSNLAKVLTTLIHASGQLPHYPIRTTGGIYSPNVGTLLLSEMYLLTFYADI